MSVIFSYPEVGLLKGNDRLLISQTDNNNATKSLSVSKLVSFVSSGGVVDPVSGTGTAGIIPLWKSFLSEIIFLDQD